MTESVLLNVNGMKCGGCEANVTKALSALDGVLTVVAKHKEKTIAVEFAAEKISEEEIEQAITKAGFAVV